VSELRTVPNPGGDGRSSVSPSWSIVSYFNPKSIRF